MAYKLKVDGTTEQLPDCELETLQEAVGGYIEAVFLGGDDVMIVNEEGKIIGLPVNNHATTLAWERLSKYRLYTEYIVGDVVIAKRKGEELY